MQLVTSVSNTIVSITALICIDNTDLYVFDDRSDSIEVLVQKIQ